MRLIALSVCALSIAFTSCKNGEKSEVKTEAPVETVKVDPNSFKAIFEVVAKHDDRFHLYYTEDGSINFSEDKSLWADVKGSDASQNVVFDFPDDIVPTQLRIDFGSNPDQGQMEIKNFKMTYYGKTFEAKDKFFFDYFGSNVNTVTVDKDKAIITPIKKAGTDYVGPSFYPSQEALAAQIKNLVENPGTQPAVK